MSSSPSSFCRLSVRLVASVAPIANRNPTESSISGAIFQQQQQHRPPINDNETDWWWVVRELMLRSRWACPGVGVSVGCVLSIARYLETEAANLLPDSWSIYGLLSMATYFNVTTNFPLHQRRLARLTAGPVWGSHISSVPACTKSGRAHTHRRECHHATFIGRGEQRKPPRNVTAITVRDLWALSSVPQREASEKHVNIIHRCGWPIFAAHRKMVTSPQRELLRIGNDRSIVF